VDLSNHNRKILKNKNPQEIEGFFVGTNIGVFNIYVKPICNYEFRNFQNR